MSLEKRADNILDQIGMKLPEDISKWDRKDEDMKVLVRPASYWKDQLMEAFRQGSPIKHSGMLWEKALGKIEFRPGEVSMWAGYNKERKSTFTSQVMLDLIKQGERVLCVSLEMQPIATLKRAARQAFGDDDVSLEYLDKFSDWAGGNWWIFDFVGRLSPRTAMALCRYFRDVYKGTHVFLDSFMKIVESEQEIDTHKNFMNQIVACAMETQLHIHVVHHMRKPDSNSHKIAGRYEMKGSSALSDMPDNCFVVSRDRETEQKQKKGEDLDKPNFYLKCDAQRNGEWEGTLGFWFDSPSMQFLEKPSVTPLRYSF